MIYIILIIFQENARYCSQKYILLVMIRNKLFYDCVHIYFESYYLSVLKEQRNDFTLFSTFCFVGDCNSGWFQNIRKIVQCNLSLFYLASYQIHFFNGAFTSFQKNRKVLNRTSKLSDRIKVSQCSNVSFQHIDLHRLFTQGNRPLNCCQN